MKIALAQMQVVGGEPDKNLARAGRRIEQAASLGADLVLLPEALDFGWMHPSAWSGAGPIPGGETFAYLSAAAEKNRIHVCAGLVEQDGGRLYNSAVLLGRDGELLTRHRKINELEIAHEIYSRGTTAAAVCETEYGVIGLEICADGFAEHQWISRELCKLKADLILSPCAWAVEADFDPTVNVYGKIWRDNLAPVARECGVWIVACSNVGWITEGPWRGRKCIGNSMAFDTGGNEVLTGPFGEEADELLMIEI